MEHIVSFLPDQMLDQDVFCVEMAGITYPDKNYHIIRSHAHIYCMEYILSGKGYVRCDGVSFFPQKGDVYCLPAGVRHEYGASAEAPFEKIWFNVRGTLCESLLRTYRLEGQFYFPERPLYPLFKRFLTVCENERQNTAKMLAACALLLHEIVLNLSGVAQGGSDFSERSAAVQAKEYMDERVYGGLSMDEAAQQVALSKSQLNRAFKKEYGMTPYDYFLSRKIDIACLLLQNTAMQIKEIAYKLQFADEHYFSSVFRKRKGMPPREYREVHALGLERDRPCGPPPAQGIAAMNQTP